MRSVSWLGMWVCAVITAAGAGLLRAQPAPGPAPTSSAAEPAGYRELVQEAVREHQAGNFGEARSLFARAHALYPNARTLKGLGMAEFELRNYRESVQALEASLASTVKPLTPELRADAQQLLVRAQSFLGKVVVLVSPPQTRILVDGATAPFAADGSVLLTAGDHVLDASAEGHEPMRKTVKVIGGDQQTLTFQLVPIAAPLQQSPVPRAPPRSPEPNAPPPGSGTVAVDGYMPPVELASSYSLPKSVRLYAGMRFGFLGTYSQTLEHEDQRLEIEADLAVTYGFQLGASLLTLAYFDLGPELRFAWLGFDTEGESERQLYIDVVAKPRLRFDVPPANLELYATVPLGLTIPSLSGELGDPSLGFNVGFGGGAVLYVSERFGINLELMYLMHMYGGSITDDESGIVVDSSTSFGQLSLFVNLVLAF